MKLRSIINPTIEPFEYKKPKTNKRICVFDCETDPFEHGSQIKPFSCGFYDGETYIDFWGDDCIDQFARYLLTRIDEVLLIYAHNLGGFDIHFLYDYFDNGIKPLIINARIVKAYLLHQEWRDSYKIIPAPLRDMQKDVFDYSKLKRNIREEFKDEILLYQRHDCEYLHEYIVEFHNEFGNRITVGNTAINILQSFYGFARLTERQDRNIRDFFYGGRCQVFEAGVIEDDFKVYDVNSMYPYVMREYRHPIGGVIHNSKVIDDDTAFVELDAWNNGCLPVRGSGGDLDFTCRFGRFFATIHELKAGLETGDVKVKRVHRILNFYQWTDFHLFVDHFYNRRLEAKDNGDKIRALFYKLILNSAYGKFAQDPTKYGDYVILDIDEMPEGGMHHKEENPDGWEPRYENGSRRIWWKRTSGRRPNFFNVATGASITGAARAELYKGIRSSDRVVYCDTDSVICRGSGVRLDERTLGAWKLEGEGSRIAIGGKKLYCLFDADGNVVKKASKGAQLSGEQILQVANGVEIEYRPEVPTFKLFDGMVYETRKINRTGAA